MTSRAEDVHSGMREDQQPAGLTRFSAPIVAKAGQRIRLTVPKATTAAELRLFAYRLAQLLGVAK